MGFFEKLKNGLKKTKNALLAPIEDLFASFKQLDDDFYEELGDVLISADVGVTVTEEIVDELRARVKAQKIKEPNEAKSMLVDIIKEMVGKGEPLKLDTTPSVVLVIGVNGVGKTTSIGKIALSLKNEGKKVMLCAADTFRAAAIDQLAVWADRAGVPMIKQSEGSDPAAVVFDAISAAKKQNVDVLIIDTAGRLHNKTNLINELAKINRIIDRELNGCSKETLIVLDAVTGQNAVNQASEFKKAAEITGIVLTKLDGTAKGGIVIAIKKVLGIPVKYVGVGEGADDLQIFDGDEFVDALFKE